VVVPWTVAYSPELSGAAPHDTDRPGLARACRVLRDRLFAELGVPLPPAEVRLDRSLSGASAALHVRELPAGTPIALDEAAPPLAVEEQLVQLLLPRLRRRAASFIGISEVQQLLARLERLRPGGVRSVVPDKLTVTTLTEVLRRLADEGVSIRDLSGILEAIAQAPSSADPLELCERVRERLAEATTHRLTGGEGRLPVLCLDRIVEDTIEDAITTTPTGRFLALGPAIARDIVTAVHDAAVGHPDAVILTRPEIRRFVRRLLESRLPDLPVVSFAELSPEVILETRATVRVA
jgi:type III secretion protein V